MSVESFATAARRAFVPFCSSWPQAARAKARDVYKRQEGYRPHRGFADFVYGICVCRGVRLAYPAREDVYKRQAHGDALGHAGCDADTGADTDTGSNGYAGTDTGTDTAANPCANGNARTYCTRCV